MAIVANEERPVTKGDLSELETRLTKWVVQVVAIAVGISTAVLGFDDNHCGRADCTIEVVSQSAQLEN